jgi:hypothetical protein
VEYGAGWFRGVLWGWRDCPDYRHDLVCGLGKRGNGKPDTHGTGASNAKKATESNAERLETAETKEASGQEQDMEPEEKTDAKRNGISEVKRATESNAKRTALSEETEAEPKAIEKENQK